MTETHTEYETGDNVCPHGPGPRFDCERCAEEDHDARGDRPPLGTLLVGWSGDTSLDDARDGFVERFGHEPEWNVARIQRERGRE